LATYQQTLDYLFTQLPMYQRVGKQAFKKDLTNIKAFAAYLGSPESSFDSIHIAGTNGKGSSAHMLAAILQAGGRRVGLYTSPHYKDFRERIKINGNYISKREVVQFVEKHEAFIKKQKPSFFEITVAMAFNYFATQKVDIAIIETGLGGRLDSTNIIRPLLSIITNISFDHEAMLGNTLPKIAKEKAGIIKKQIPVVVGEYKKETAEVFKRKAKQQNSKIYFASKSLYCVAKKEDLEHSNFTIKSKGRKVNYKVNAHGAFQSKNLITVLKAIDVLKEVNNFKISQQDIRNGLCDLINLTAYQGSYKTRADCSKITG
jgi:dihydrofolate synthase/folylpolyglutamate synthase